MLPPLFALTNIKSAGVILHKVWLGAIFLIIASSVIVSRIVSVILDILLPKLILKPVDRENESGNREFPVNAGKDGVKV